MSKRTPDPKQNAASIEMIAGQIMAMQMLLETIIIDDIRSNAFSSELMLSVIDQGLEVFPKNKHLSENELLGAIGTLKSTLNAIEVAKTGKIPVN